MTRSTLNFDDSLTQDDLLISPGGTYNLVIKDDGSLVIAFSSKRWDPNDALAATFFGTAGAAGKYVLQCQGGQFVVSGADGKTLFAVGSSGNRSSLTLNDDGTLTWSNGGVGATKVFGTPNILQSIDKVYSLTYDLANAVIGKATPTDIYTQSATNPSKDQPQKTNITHSEGVSEMQSWSNAVSVGVEVKSSFKVGIPFIAKGKVEVTLKTNYTYQWGGSKTTVRNMSFSVDMICPPDTNTECTMLVTISPITVPYTTVADVTYASGLKLTNVPIQSLYQGLTAHNLQAAYTYTRLDPSQNATAAASKPEIETIAPDRYSFAEA